MWLKDLEKMLSDFKAAHDVKPSEASNVDSIFFGGGRNLQRYKVENRTYNMCLAAVTRDGTAIEFVPEKMRTKEMYATACKSDGRALKYIPEDRITLSMCKEAVSIQGFVLEYVPVRLRTAQICKIAVLKQKEALLYVPKSVLTPAFCASIVKQKSAEWIAKIPKEAKSAQFYEELVSLNPDAIWGVPVSYRSSEIYQIYMERKKYKKPVDAIKADDRIIGFLPLSCYDHETCVAISQSKNFIDAVKNARWVNDPLQVSTGHVHLKKILRFPDISLEVVKAHPFMMQYVPQEGQSPEVIMEALSSPWGLGYISRSKRAKDLCEIAFSKDPYNIQHIPDEYKTPEMCLAAVKHSGFLLEYIPDDLKTTEMCKIAVADEGRGTPYVPERLYDKDLALLVLKNPGCKVFPLTIIPKKFLDYDMCKYAVSNISGSLQDVPKEYIDYDMCLCAVKEDPRAAKYIPEQFFTPEIALATARYSDCFKYIPKDKITEEACMEYIRNGAIVEEDHFADIPDRFVTKELCDYAFQISCKYISAIPDAFITEEMLMEVAKNYPGLLHHKVRKSLRTEGLFKKLIEINPDAEKWLPSIVNSLLET